MSRFCFVTVLLPYITSRLGGDRQGHSHSLSSPVARQIGGVVWCGVCSRHQSTELLYCHLISMMMTQFDEEGWLVIGVRL